MKLFFAVESSEIEQEKGILADGAVGKQNVAMIAESIPLEDIKTGKKRNKYVSIKLRFCKVMIRK